MDVNKTEQIDFCENSLQNIQNLIARMDLKAGIVLTIAGLLSPGVYPFVVALFEHHASATLRFALFCILAIYFVMLIFILWQIRKVFIARPASVGNYSQAPLMLYPFLILKNFKSDKDYAAKALELSHENIISDYANQIMECSNIYSLKHEHVNKAINGLLLLLVPWVLFLATSTGFLLLQKDLSDPHSKPEIASVDSKVNGVATAISAVDKGTALRPKAR